MEDVRDERGDGGDIVAILFLGVIGLAIWGGYTVFRDHSGGEIEGTVKYDDCRQILSVDPPGQALFGGRQYVCTKFLTNSGKLMLANCVSDDTTPDGKCEKAYVYSRGPSVKCSKDYPYLGMDDKCYSGYVNGSVIAYK